VDILGASGALDRGSNPRGGAFYQSGPALLNRIPFYKSLPYAYMIYHLGRRGKMPNDLKPKNIDEYISQLPGDIQLILQKMRAMIRSAAPDAEETISYRMPAFKQNSVLVYFAACKGYIGFYPTPSPIVAFKKEFASYKQSKGAIQFPIDEPIPVDLVKKIVEYRVKEDKAKAKSKKQSK
jgi:uncharacterized protein YdhG (YjbR/CyaY superfamily)